MKVSLKSKHIVVTDASRSGGALITWLLDQGAQVTVAGIDDEKAITALARHVEAHIKKTARDGKDYIKRQASVMWADEGIRALKAKADMVIGPGDEAPFFFEHRTAKTIAITGAHGKTTTALWAAHLIGDAVVAGHVPEKPLMTAMRESKKVAVVELSPQVLKGYQPTLLVNTDESGVVSPDLALDRSAFISLWGHHNIGNLTAAVRAARLAGTSYAQMKPRISSLPQVSQHQELIHESAKLTIIDDSAAIGPDQGIPAIRRFGGPNCILIAGGDGRRSFHDWAGVVGEHIRLTNLVLVAGSATRAMRQSLGDCSRGVRAHATLQSALKAALARAKLHMSATILFSPAGRVDESFSETVEQMI